MFTSWSSKQQFTNYDCIRKKLANCLQTTTPPIFQEVKPEVKLMNIQTFLILQHWLIDDFTWKLR